MNLVSKTRFAMLALLMASPTLAQDDLGVARYTADGELLYPENAAEWIHMGTSLGSDYNDEPFDPARPGTLGVVLMEPSAYRYFREHGTYADGTMFLLSFYESETKSQPRLNGFVQGAMRAQEIHVIDQRRFAEGSAFFLYSGPEQASSAMVPEGSECIQCHAAEGDYRATFIQFYPTIRDLPRR